MNIVNAIIKCYDVFGEYTGCITHPVFTGTLEECQSYCSVMENNFQEQDQLFLGNQKFPYTIIKIDPTDEMGSIYLGENKYFFFEIAELSSLTIHRVEER